MRFKNDTLKSQLDDRCLSLTSPFIAFLLGGPTSPDFRDVGILNRDEEVSYEIQPIFAAFTAKPHPSVPLECASSVWIQWPEVRGCLQTA
jgi:hypothetical protein